MAEQTSTIENKTTRIRELVDTLSAAGRAYYQESREIMSNFEYDRLYDELAELEKETGIVFAGSPTQNVGYEVMSSLPRKTDAFPEQDKECGRAAGMAWRSEGTSFLEDGRPDHCADL
jgi:DNA ligase (NAD+)